LIARPRPVPAQSKIAVARSRRGGAIEILHSTEPDFGVQRHCATERGLFGSDEPITQALMILLLQIEAGCRPVNKQSTVGSGQPTLCKAGASSYD